MAEISATDVKELRGRTGAGMMECKRALQEAGGNMDDAITILRKAGAAKAEKKSSRSTGEGRIAAHVDSAGGDRTGALVEINCETDFVARTEDFKAFSREVAEIAVSAAPRWASAEDRDEAGATSGDLLVDQRLPSGGQSVGEALAAMIGRLGENMKIRRMARLAVEPGSFGRVATYVHAGDKIGVLVELACGTEAAAQSDEVKELGRDIAMHVAAANPRFIARGEVTQAVLDKEREIYRSIAINEGKPEALVEKVVEGRISKYYAEACLLEQPFVKNPDVTVGRLAKDKGTKLGTTIEVRHFARMAIGD